MGASASHSVGLGCVGEHAVGRIFLGTQVYDASVCVRVWGLGLGFVCNVY